MPSKKFDVVVVGGANWDYLIRGKKLPGGGETAEGEQFHEGAGGKGANQAVAAARLGARVAFVARVGSDIRGDALLRLLNQEGVDTRFVVRDSSTSTGVALIMVDENGQKQIQTAPGANRQFSPHNVQESAEVLRSAKVVLSQLEVPLPSVATTLRIAKEAGAKTILDPAPPVRLDDEILQLVDFVRPNSNEAEVLTDIAVKDRESARQAARALMARGVGAVAVQSGDEGNLLVWRDGEHFLPKMKVNSVDATGAGDAFAATLAVFLAEGRELTEAGELANAAAALATTVVGAQDGLPSREKVLRLLGKA